MKNNRVAIMSGVILAMLLSALDQTIVSTAMPKIVGEFNGLSHLSWVFTAYMLASTITVPIYGKLSDMFGRRGFYIAGILIFLIGSALSGASQSMLQLIIFRAIQGIGGGAIMVNSFAIIGDIFPPQERGKFQGLIGGIFGLASIAGPLAGGWLTDNLTWRWIFYINIPLGMIAMAVLAAALPKIAHNVKARSIDYLGAIVLTTGLIPLLLALVWGGSEYAWNSGTILTLLGIAIAAFVIFPFIEKRATDPVLSLDLFKNRVFNISIVSMFLTAMGMFGAILYIPIFAQGVIGISATNSGLILTPMMIGLIAASTISGLVISKTGKYKWLALGGMIIAAIGMYLFTTITMNTTSLGLSLRMVILGIGLGSTLPIFTIAVQSAFSKERLGEVTAGTQLFRSIGGTVGTAVLGGVMNSQLASRLANIGSEPFVQTMQKLNPTSLFAKLDSNTIQGVLNPQAQQKITAAFAQAPVTLQATLAKDFDHFLTAVKIAFTQSVEHTFVIGTIVMATAVVVVLFLPQIPLRSSKRPPVEEAGVELGDELGNKDEEMNSFA